jgi:hypothetical protein
MTIQQNLFATLPEKWNPHDLQWAVKVKSQLDQHCCVTDSGCFEWQGPLSTGGYGRFLGLRSKSNLFHRSVHIAAYQLSCGPTDGLFVLHTCDNRKCFNPMHLWLGTQGNNMKDAASKGRLSCSVLRKLRISLGNKGKLLGKKQSLEHVVARTGIPRPLDSIRRAAEKNRGKKRTPEQVAHMRAARWEVPHAI